MMKAIRRALVRAPSARLADGITTHIDRVPVDVDLAARQWQGYVSAMADAGWDIQEVAPADECADSVFVEDSVVMFGPLAVLTNPGAPSRRGEIPGTAEALDRLGYQCVTINAPGTLDGGDVLKVGSRVYVGRGGRTNADGVRQLRAHLAATGLTAAEFNVTAVPLTKALHLKSAVTALPDGTVIGYAPVVDDPGFFPHFMAMPEEPGAHVVDLGDGRLLISAAAPESIARLADLGFSPVPVEISEFEKLEGCVTCLSVRLRANP
ncbi:MAG: N(G),N(G)-dimethylarginine dimethylaminohydrolase [Pseudonocardiales bacterium]|nr:N(G),N(G)-dimethylarginine dimethylaminohydrolase [Pseudonocardiales bacterium]